MNRYNFSAYRWASEQDSIFDLPILGNSFEITQRDAMHLEWVHVLKPFLVDSTPSFIVGLLLIELCGCLLAQRLDLTQRYPKWV